MMDLWVGFYKVAFGYRNGSSHSTPDSTPSWNPANSYFPFSEEFYDETSVANTSQSAASEAPVEEDLYEETDMPPSARIQNETVIAETSSKHEDEDAGRDHLNHLCHCKKIIF
jgi:hypothetical protein